MSELVPRPAISISLVTWQGLRWLPGCLASLEAQTAGDLEVLIHDNGSTDGSAAWLREWAQGRPHTRLTESEANLGFARAHDRNILAARGEAVLLLNQDVELDPGFLAAALGVLRERPDVGAVQGRLLRLGADQGRTDIIDTTGLDMHRDRRVVSRGQLVRDTGGPAWRTPGPVWGVDGAAPVYRRSALLSARLPRSDGQGLEILDGDFFAYKEDVDLAWRLRRLGWTAWYEPSALGWHARGSGPTGVQGWREIARANLSNSPRIRELSWRNQRLMQVKNEELTRFLRDLPWVARRELAAWAFIVVADRARLRAVPDLLRLLPAAWQKRRSLQRLVADRRSQGAAVEVSRPTTTPGRLLSRARATTLGRSLEYIQRRGVPAARRRAVAEVREQAWLHRARPIRSLGVVQVHPRAITARIDRPRSMEPTATQHLLVSGWAQSEAGIESVGVFIDGRLDRTAFVGRSRPDVTTRWRHLDRSTIEGFEAVVPLAGLSVGEHVVGVAVRDHAGHVRVLARRFRRLDPSTAYADYHAQVSQLPAESRPLGGLPLAPVLVVVHAGAEHGLAATLGSIRPIAQPWRCVVLADEDVAARVAALVERQLGPATAGRWAVVTDPAEAVADAPDRSRLVAFLRAGETLARSALERCRSVAAEGQVSLVYGDHDAVDASGRHVEPWFVPDWSPHRLLSQDYIGGAFLVRDGARLRAALDRLGPFAGQVAWRYALLLDVTAGAGAIAHVPSVVWSRPTHEAGPEDAVSRAEAERRAVLGALAARGEEDVVVTSDPEAHGPVRQVAWPLPKPAPRVSAIVPTTARPELVAGTIQLLTEATAYPDLEIVVLDNSRGRHPEGVAQLATAAVTVVTCDEPFNWARLSNTGARRSSGELLLFLNDDMEAVDEAWLDELVRIGVRPDVGAVGPLLLYPDGTIQHAGVVIVGHGGGAAHLFQGIEPAADLYLDLQRVTRETSAVTGACLLVSRTDFEAVGGFDEALAVSGNDVDFCLRLGAAGRRVLWTPRSVLIHHEGRSRRNVAYLPDEVRLWDRWSYRFTAGDPYSNPNLAQDRVDLDLDWSRIRL